MRVSWDYTNLDFILVISVIAIIALVIIVRYLFKKYSAVGIDRRLIRERWKKIVDLMQYKKEMNCKLAIIEADKLLDYVLKEMYFNGQTMAERLKLATYKFPKLKQVWWAHKVRNHIVHDTNYIVKYGETKRVLILFKRALKELGVL